MQNAVVFQPAVPMRAEASDRSEMVSQMLFGDTCTILEPAEKWSLVCTTEDHYEGWIDNKQLFPLSDADFLAVASWQRVSSLDITMILFDQQPMHIPMGSRIPSLDHSIIAGHSIQLNDNCQLLPSLCDAAALLLNAPYLWGGKTLMGIDCSGLVQVSARCCGVSLPRDASQQALEGVAVERVEEAQPDDLMFFSNPAGCIIHVGIYRGQGTIIHASGNVHVDRVDSQGIFSERQGRYTHHLHSIRRILL